MAAYEAYQDFIKKSEECKFFRIRGSDLDDERREVTDGMDLLTFLRGGNQDFNRIHCYLGIVSAYIVICYNMTFPSPFDYTLERQILTAMQPGWVYDPATQEGARKFCVENQPEYRYRKCLWVMIIAHFVAFCISTFYTFLSANYREINQEGYDMTKHYRMFVISSVAGFTVCTGLAYWLMTTISFPNANENTACTMENRHSYSIILLWMWADILISYFSIATVFLDYYFGKRQDIFQM